LQQLLHAQFLHEQSSGHLPSFIAHPLPQQHLSQQGLPSDLQHSRFAHLSQQAEACMPHLPCICWVAHGLSEDCLQLFSLPANEL